jgi:hypothetical protein
VLSRACCLVCDARVPISFPPSPMPVVPMCLESRQKPKRRSMGAVNCVMSSARML